MRIICENCGTKYSIADEKVRGKVFKIRCKKCGHIIVVKGAQEQAAPAAEGGFDEKETRVFDYSGFSDEEQSGGEEAGWHVVIDREQVGPLTDEQVRQKFASGEIDVETFVWREGYADWVKLGGVEEFSDLEDATVAAESPFSAGAAVPFGGVAADPAVTAETSPPVESRPADMQEPEVAASFSEPAQEEGGGLFGSPSAQDVDMSAAPQAGSSELFGSPAPSGGVAPATGGGHSLFPEEDEDDAPRPAMTGQRNENSVLFSLSNLQALATGGGASRSSGLGGGGARPGAGIASAKAEGSGLLDIRAMAASTLGDGSRDSDGGVGISVPSPFSSPMASPVLMPVAASDRPGWLIPVLALGGVLLVAVLVLGVIVVIRMGDDKAPARQEEIAKGVEKETPAASDKEKPDSEETKTDEGDKKEKSDVEEDKADSEKADEEEGDATEEAKAAAKVRAGGRTPSTTTPSKKRTTTTRTTSTPTTTSRPSTTSTAPSKKSSSADDPLAALLGSGSKPKTRPSQESASKPKPTSGGKESLTANDIRSAMGSIRGAVRRCYDKFKVTGRVNVSVTVGGNGRVKTARVSGQFSGTPTGNCVAAAVRSVRFPSFSRPSQTFAYPFLLN